jgi:uncharacterized protein YdeI (YjbR/CyaY-like superfamily)
MVQRDPRIDTYIEKAPEYARPVLAHLRAVVHAACPDVVETLKWGKPSFDHHGMLCGMAAFKAHAAFGFWKHALVVDDAQGKELEAMGSFGKITSVRDLPSKAVLTRYVKKAMKLNEDGVKVTRPKHSPKKPSPLHPEFKAALARNKKAQATFDAFPPSHRREYVDWVAEAKRDETRERRIEQAIEWLAEGKSRNWKYESC